MSDELGENRARNPCYFCPLIAHNSSLITPLKVDENLNWKIRLYGLGYIVTMFGMILLNVREFPIFSNTIGIGRLALCSALVMATLAAVLIFVLRNWLAPWKSNWPGIVFVVFPMLFFAPMLGSLLNRSSWEQTDQPFQFIAEQAYFAAGYGVIRGEKVQPTGYRLSVREQGKDFVFKYKSQPFYPLSKPGDTVLLPVKTGLLGFRIVALK